MSEQTRITNMNVNLSAQAASTCVHHFCGNSWVTRPSTTAGDLGGTTAWGVCCKCGAYSEPAYRDGP
jgi:hypothetical protein